MPLPPWKQPTGLAAVVGAWLDSGQVHPCFTCDRTLPERDGVWADLPADLHAGLARALRDAGIERLYAHQAEAREAARAGRHVVVATPTASGKSLCFHLPVLERLCAEPEARALYLHPTKALSRDQEAAIGDLIAAAGLPVSRVVYDGDTPGDARRAARERGSIVMTNPDMLHAGILPHHPQWARLFSRLRFVVVDELHTYRGVFGSHMAHVLARLRRIARFHGADPVFLCATATIRNPREHAARLLGVAPDAIALVDRSGAPAGSRRFFLYNPPVANAELSIRASYLKSAVSLAGDLLRARVPTIVFGQSRNAVEIMLKYLRDRCAGAVDDGAIMAYRGGYLPEQRRRVERGLRDGEILGVVATNALELGIDVGELDAVVCAAYPGSIAATWQRFGRAGRRRGESIAVLVASSHPVDQFLAQNPEYLLSSAVEEARIDPDNAEVLIQHVKCAAFELPFPASGAEPYATLDGESTRQALDFLARHGVVHLSGDRYHWAADAFPANDVSLRRVGWDNFVVIDLEADRAIAEMDWRAAHTMLHEQAIYQHDGEQYQVERLDFDDHKAFVRKVAPDYFTQAMTRRVVSVLEEAGSRPLGQARASRGEVAIVEKVVGYKKIKFYTHENAGYGDVRLPEMQMHTTSFWITLPAALSRAIGREAAAVGLRGAGRAIETVASVALFCDPHDIGQAMGDRGAAAAAGGAAEPDAEDASAASEPTLYLFDNVPGGVGLAGRMYELADDLVDRARALVEGCRCAAGCPACVGPPDEDVVPRRDATRAVLEALSSDSRDERGGASPRG